MTETFLTWLRELIRRGDTHPFYVCQTWRNLSTQVLEMDRHECQICKAARRYSRADLVHHVNHVKRRPDLALDIWWDDPEKGRTRNLISVCRGCHETACHPERMRRELPRETGFRNEERWD